MGPVLCYPIQSTRGRPVAIDAEPSKPDNGRMKVCMSRAVIWAMSVGIVGGLGFGPFGPSSRAEELHAVQPGGRIVGTWVTDPANVVEYLNAILFPVATQCERFEGSIQFKFTPGPASRISVVSGNTLEIWADAVIVHLSKSSSNPGPPTRISFGLNLAYAAPYTVLAEHQLLEFGGPSPDASSTSIENLMVNDVEVMRESGSIDMLGVETSVATTQMRFEFEGDDRLKLTPIFPPAPDGVPIDPRPLILRRQ